MQGVHRGAPQQQQDDDPDAARFAVRNSTALISGDMWVNKCTCGHTEQAPFIYRHGLLLISWVLAGSQT